MSSQYLPVTDNDRLLAHFGVAMPQVPALQTAGEDGGLVPVIVPAEDNAHGSLSEARMGWLGMPTRRPAELAQAPATAHCGVEVMKSQPAFRESWWAARRCIMPAEHLWVWRYAGGRAQRWQIERADTAPLALAGLWKAWPSPSGEPALSFSLLTLPAAGHTVFDDDERMPVMLPPHALAAWLHGSLPDAERLLRPCPADLLKLTADAAPGPARHEPESWAAVPDMFAPEWLALANDVGTGQGSARRTRLPRAPQRRRPDSPGPTTAELF